MELTNLFPTPIHLQEKKHWEGGVSKIYVYIYIYIYIERERERERLQGLYFGNNQGSWDFKILELSPSKYYVK